MKEIPLVGYADKFSLEPDETINFKVSSNSTRPYSARLVRVISGDPNPEGPGLIEEELDASFNGKHPSRKQDIQTGSYIKVDTKSSLKDLKSFTFGATIWPTMPNKYLQTMISTFDTSSKTGIILEIGSKVRKDFSIKDVHTSDEAFVTGTFAGIIPAINIDGYKISNGIRG